MDLIERQAAIDALDEIRHALWEIDIPSPTVPEYVEHHEQVQSVWKLLDKKQKELYVLPSVQPEQCDFEKQLHDMFDHIWYCEIDHPVFQDTVGDLMRAVIDAYYRTPQPEIIRCKDCKFYTPLNRETKSGVCSLLIHQNFGDDWYCAGAERRTDEC